MIYLIAIVVSLGLLGGFLILTGIEGKRGARILGRARAAFDKRVSRVSFILRHVDWAAFVRHIVGQSVSRIIHDVAHTVLVLVRAIERVLTRTVKYLRERRGAPHTASEPEDGLGPLKKAVHHLRHALRQARRKRGREAQEG